MTPGCQRRSKSFLLPSCFALAKLPFCNLSWKLLQNCMDLYGCPRLCNPSQGFGTLLVVNVILYLNSSALHCWANKGVTLSYEILYGNSIAIFHTGVQVPQEAGHGQYSPSFPSEILCLARIQLPSSFLHSHLRACISSCPLQVCKYIHKADEYGVKILF